MTKTRVQSVTAVSVVLATLLVDAAPLWAQDRPSQPHVVQAATQQSYSIAPQSLESAVPLFARQSGRQITADAALVNGLSTQGVQGTMTIEAALQRLLAGTGLTYSVVSGTTIALQRVGQSGLPPGVMQLDPVQVQGMFPVPSQAIIDNLPPPYAGGQVATGGQLGLLGNRGVMDTPFNQTNYTSQKVQDQQARTIKEAVVDDPSIRVARPDAGPGVDGYFVRGFLIGNADLAYGGMYGLLPHYTTASQLAERVEVLKGPSALLSGIAPAGAIGGVINIVPKRAPDSDLTQATASYMSAGTFGGHVDVARRFGQDKQFGVRFNGVFNAGETYIENNTNQLGLGVLNLDFRGERVRFAIDAGYQEQYIGGLQPYVTLAAAVPVPYAPDARKNLGQPWNDVRRKDLFGVVRGEVDISENVTAYASYGAHDLRRENLWTPAVNVTNFYGAATSQAPVNGSEYYSIWTWQAGVRANIDTGPIGHEISANYTNFKRVIGSASVSSPAPLLTNLYSPTIVARPNLPTPAANKESSANQSGLAIADTLSAANKRVQLTVGARYQSVGQTNYNVTTGVPTSNYLAEAVSPGVALVLKPFWDNVSFYGNYIQGLQQGIVVGPQFTNAGQAFPPYKSTQFEAGVKVDWGKFTTTASVFQISQPSIITNVVANTQELAGEQINSGLEFNVFGEPVDGVRLLGGFMFINALLTKTQGGATDNWTAPGVPGFQANLAGEWDLPFVKGLTLTSRFVYTGPQYLDTVWPRRMVPEWARFDIGARYAFENPGAKGKLLVARFNVDNVLDADYWMGATFSQLQVGPPRMFRLSLTADF